MLSRVEVRSAGDAGNGCFARGAGSSGQGIPAGTKVLDGARPLVWAVTDKHEGRNCRQCLQPSLAETPAGSPHPRTRCPKCLRSVLCSGCEARRATASASASASTPHDRLECEALVALTTLQSEQPGLAESLLGGSTVYLRLLLMLLAMRASGRHGSTSAREETAAHAPQLRDVEDLEDHLEDILDGGELEARMGNTIRAARLVAPAAWKANQNTCAEFLGKLYCNSMTIGRAGFLVPLARQRYWSGIRGCTYTDFGVGLFPAGAMFNHSCRPNCSWRTDSSGALSVVAVENIPADSQLFISYVDILQPRTVRRDLLRGHFFFDCACERCVYRSPSHPQEKPRRCDSSGSGSGRGDAEDFISGGWVCPRRSCGGEGRILPPSWSLRGHSGQESDREEDEDENEEDEEGGESQHCRCDSCGGVTDEAYFDRWTDLFAARLERADGDLEGGRVRDGRRRLAELQTLCERRLAPYHAFSLSVLCRLSLAAAVGGDWPATAAHAERALECMRGLVDGIGWGTGGGSVGREGIGSNGVGPEDLRIRGVESGGRSEGIKDARESGRKRGRSGRDDGRGGGSSGGAGSSTEVASGCRLHAAAIWEAVLVEVLDRALPFAGRGGERETESHRTRVASAERAGAVFGLPRSSLVELM